MHSRHNTKIVQRYELILNPARNTTFFIHKKDNCKIQIAIKMRILTTVIRFATLLRDWIERRYYSVICSSFFARRSLLIERHRYIRIHHLNRRRNLIIGTLKILRHRQIHQTFSAKRTKLCRRSHMHHTIRRKTIRRIGRIQQTRVGRFSKRHNRTRSRTTSTKRLTTCRNRLHWNSCLSVKHLIRRRSRSRSGGSTITHLLIYI